MDFGSHYQFLKRSWRTVIPRTLAISLSLIGVAILLIWEWPAPPVAQEIFWQPNNESLRPAGFWNQIGVHTLVVQWTITNKKAWCSIPNFPAWKSQPDWKRLSEEPWARQIVLGLAGDFQVPLARSQSTKLITESWKIVGQPPIKPTAWYAPAEVSPGWKNTKQIRAYLDSLPKPLWVSIYGTQKLHGKTLVRWVRSWLPHRVGLYYQDGVGEGWATPAEARRQVDTLKKALGKQRVRVIVEAYQESASGKIEATSIWSVWHQLQVFHGNTVAIFSTQQFGILQTFEIKALDLLYGK